MAIQFHVKSVPFDWDREDVIRPWIESTIHTELPSVSIGEISIVFCSDEYLLDINRRYLDHDYYTDIITFPFSDQPLSADLYISVERVKENASDLGTEFADELARVIIHGILHLCGYQDSSPDEKRQMRKMENHYLAMLTSV